MSLIFHLPYLSYIIHITYIADLFLRMIIYINIYKILSGFATNIHSLRMAYLM